MSIIYKNISKSFDNNTVLNNINAEIPSGRVCLHGPSGCGKTTLMSVTAGIQKPECGEILGVSGAVTFLFQEQRLFALSALDNVAIVARGKDKKEKARELLLSLGLTEDDISKLPSELSGGMNQRVAIARALLFFQEKGGNTVIFDEPFKGLDSETKKEVARVILDTLDAENFITVTHDREDAELLHAISLDFADISGESL